MYDCAQVLAIGSMARPTRTSVFCQRRGLSSHSRIVPVVVTAIPSLPRSSTGGRRHDVITPPPDCAFVGCAPCRVGRGARHYSMLFLGSPASSGIRCRCFVRDDAPSIPPHVVDRQSPSTQLLAVGRLQMRLQILQRRPTRVSLASSFDHSDSVAEADGCPAAGVKSQTRC